jgi:hypothetical protein
MRIYLDDLRPTPAYLSIDEYADERRSYTDRCYTAQEAIELLYSGQVEFISFDHDLGSPENGTGYDVAKWIERAAAMDPTWPIPDYAIHSANPVGAVNIDRAMKAALYRRSTEGTPKEL